MTVDEKNGTILSVMMAAGTKNNNNEFTGVIMGETDLPKTEGIRDKDDGGNGL